MALVNFYAQTPSATQVAADLRDYEFVVIESLPDEKGFFNEVEALVDFDFVRRHENTDLPEINDIWFFVMHRSESITPPQLKKLRVMVADWVRRDSPNQVKHI